jgi:hypothetical protein
MTEHKTMNTIIHAAFRRDLARFGAALSGFPAGSRERAGQLKSAWDNFAFQLHHHHEDEETIFWPALQEVGADLSLVADLDGEHEAMKQALDEADAAMARFAGEPAPGQVAGATQAIAHLRTVLLDHLAHEERDMEPISARYHQSPPLLAAQKSVRKAHRGNMGTFFAWLQDGADADAKAALRREVPPPVLVVITALAGRRYRRTVAPVWS